MPTYRHYDEEFKRNSVELFHTSNRSIPQLAHELGIAPETLRNWINKKIGTLKGKTQGADTPEESLKELERLRKELYQVTRQRDILKKALAIVNQQENGELK